MEEKELEKLIAEAKSEASAVLAEYKEKHEEQEPSRLLRKIREEENKNKKIRKRKRAWFTALTVSVVGLSCVVGWFHTPDYKQMMISKSPLYQSYSSALEQAISSRGSADYPELIRTLEREVSEHSFPGKVPLEIMVFGYDRIMLNDTALEYKSPSPKSKEEIISFLKSKFYNVLTEDSPTMKKAIPTMERLDTNLEQWLLLYQRLKDAAVLDILAINSIDMLIDGSIDNGELSDAPKFYLTKDSQLYTEVKSAYGNYFVSIKLDSAYKIEMCQTILFK